MENSKTVAQTLLGETAHFGFCSPKIGLFRGVGGAPKFFFLPWNPIIFVSKKHMKIFKTVAQTLLGETAHFSFCPPKIGFFRGVRGVPEICFSLESSYFCEIGAHAKF